MKNAPVRNQTAALTLVLMVCQLTLGGFPAALSPAQAHPHIFIVQRLTAVFDQTGLAGIRVRWKFDDMFAAMIAEDFDLDRNGRLDPSEVAEIKENALIAARPRQPDLFRHDPSLDAFPAVSPKAMMRAAVILILVVGAASWAGTAWSQNPFTSRPQTQAAPPEPLVKSRLFATLIHWQHQLQRRMSDLIRAARSDGRIQPLIVLMGLALAYGALHAAGPGHGKFIAVAYVLSGNASLAGGLLLGLCIALLHGFSGVFGVLGLRYLIQWSVSDTIDTVTAVTQIVSFGLIAVLGLLILIKNGWALFQAPPTATPPPASTSPKGSLPWVLAAGLVPCPAVVMVMLFCLSMGVPALGLLLAGAISLGMALTLTLVISAVVMGKTGALRAAPHRHVKAIETTLGMLSGAAVMTIGCLFLLTAWRSASL